MVNYICLFENISQVPNFRSSTSVVTCFIEYEDTILVLKRSSKENQPFIWGTPGGEIDPKQDVNEESALIREVFEETGINVNVRELCFVAKRYARIPVCDYTLYIYYLKMNEKPEITLSEEHTEAKWEHKSTFKSLDLLKSQDEAFDIIFDERICNISKLRYFV